MGSYTVYGGSGIVNYAIADMAESKPVVIEQLAAVKEGLPAEGDTTLAILESLNIDAISITDGHIFISGVSALDIGSTVVILLTAVATLIRAYYDMSDWRDRRRISKLVLRRSQARERGDGERNERPGDVG